MADLDFITTRLATGGDLADADAARLDVEEWQRLGRRVHDLKRNRHVDQHIGLPEPEDHTDDDDRILAMAEMSVHETVELGEDELAMYVMDQWRWKQSSNDSTDRYRR